MTAAIELMRDQKKVYNHEILEAISGLKIERREQQELSLLVNQISLGMVATKDVMAKNGVLIIPKGQTITLPLLQGLKNFSQQVGVVEPIGVMVGQAEEIPNAA